MTTSSEGHVPYIAKKKSCIYGKRSRTGKQDCDPEQVLYYALKATKNEPRRLESLLAVELTYS